MRRLRILLGRGIKMLACNPRAIDPPVLPGCLLYHYWACPYCARVRRAVQRLGIGLEMVDIDRYPAERDALLQGGGKVQVPCLRITDAGSTRWLYESKAIVRFLEQECVR